VIRIDGRSRHARLAPANRRPIQSALAGLVARTQHFRRAGDHVDADLAEYQALAAGHIGVAGQRFSRPAQCSRCRKRVRPLLRAADAIDLVDAGELRAATLRVRSCRPAAGTTMTNRSQPATLAGTAFIKHDEGEFAELLVQTLLEFPGTVPLLFAVTPWLQSDEKEAVVTGPDKTAS